MWSQIIGAIVGAAGGAAYGGYTTYKTAKKNADVYKKAALLYGYDTNKYSGQNANESMINSGKEQGRIQNAGTMNAAASQAQRGNSQMANALKGASNVAANNTYSSGYNTGSQNRSTLNNAEFNRDTALAQQMMNQADINYKRDTAMNQLGLNTAAGAANTYKNVVSDEDAKEYNNKAGLPKADVDDALRKVESIQYQYKPEMGLDDEEHVGVSAQSVQQSPFSDMVKKQDNGYLSLDKQMMLEAVFAGIASLRKELDDLESEDNNITSDEECKESVENAIENNPEEAAATLPEGSDIQKEAEQAIDGGKDKEVNDSVVSKFVGMLGTKAGSNVSANVDIDASADVDAAIDNIPEITNTNFSAGTISPVSVETNSNISSASLPEMTVVNTESSNDKAFSGNDDITQTSAQRVNVGSNGMLSSVGNGGTVSSGATKNSGSIKSNKQKLPSNEAQTQDYSETLSGDEMRDVYVQKLNEQSKGIDQAEIDNTPEMSTFNGVPFDKLDNEQLEQVERLINKG